jgi:hypothetical protein
MEEYADAVSSVRRRAQRHYTATNSTSESLNSSASTLALSERHLRELRDGSGLLDEVIAERGYRSATSTAELRSLGFADYQARLVPALLVPLHGVDGSNSRYVIKADKPRMRSEPGKPPKPIKYDFPAGQLTCLDVPVRCQTSLLDGAVDLWITEGCKKGDSLAQAGKCVVVLSGVWNWCHRDADGNSGVPLDDWQPLIPSLDGRRVFICFDSDAASNPQVGLAERRLANFLRKHSAWVYFVRLPSQPDGSKNGADDFLLRYGADELDKLAQAAVQTDADAVQLQARVRQLEQQLSLQARMLRNPRLHPGEKLALYAVANEIGWASSAGKLLPYKVNYGRLAEVAGVSAQSVSSAVKVLSGPGGLFEQTNTRELSADGQLRTRVLLTPRVDGGVLGLLQAASEYEPERSAWGGKRIPRCPEHPLADVVVRRTLTCAECSKVLDDRANRLKCHLDIPGDDAEEERDVLSPSAPRTTVDQLDNPELDNIRPHRSRVDDDSPGLCLKCERELSDARWHPPERQDVPAALGDAARNCATCGGSLQRYEIDECLLCDGVDDKPF